MKCNKKYKCGVQDCETCVEIQWDFCDEHKCQAKDCKMAVSRSMHFCVNHNCIHAGCGQFVDGSETYMYCNKTHHYTCEVKDCMSEVNHGYSLCVQHMIYGTKNLWGYTKEIEEQRIRLKADTMPQYKDRLSSIGNIIKMSIEQNLNVPSYILDEYNKLLSEE